MKEIILGTAADLARDFLYYDRKEDEELEVGAIEQAIQDGTVSVDEIVQAFRSALESDLNEG